MQRFTRTARFRALTGQAGALKQPFRSACGVTLSGISLVITPGLLFAPCRIGLPSPFGRGLHPPRQGAGRINVHGPLPRIPDPALPAVPRTGSPSGMNPPDQRRDDLQPESQPKAERPHALHSASFTANECGIRRFIAQNSFRSARLHRSMNLLEPRLSCDEEPCGVKKKSQAGVRFPGVILFVDSTACAGRHLKKLWINQNRGLVWRS